MKMQLSCGVYPAMLEERVVWEDPEVFGAGVSRIGTAEKESDRIQIPQSVRAKRAEQFYRLLLHIGAAPAD